MSDNIFYIDKPVTREEREEVVKLMAEQGIFNDPAFESHLISHKVRQRANKILADKYLDSLSKDDAYKQIEQAIKQAKRDCDE